MFVTARGVRWRVEVEGEGFPVLFLHGFLGTAESWEEPALALSGRRLTVRPDLLGHGLTDAPSDPERYAIEEAALDCVALMDALGYARFDLVGYSMGGRIALHILLAAGKRVRRAVLESTSFGIEDEIAREERRRADEEMAEEILAGGVAAFVDRWERLPLFATQASLPAEVRLRQRQQRLRHTAAGLANSLRGMGQGAQKCLLPRLREVENPVLLIAGGLDPKYVGISETMRKELRDAAVSIVPDAGHNVHLERPGEVLELLESFLMPDL